MKNREISLRRERIVQLVYERGRLTTREASLLLNITQETVRQDFNALARLGIIKRVHGAAIPQMTDSVNAIQVRETINYQGKAKIAEAAFYYLQDFLTCRKKGSDCLIGLDIGSTVSMLSEFLARERGLQVVTNSYRVIQHMIRSDNAVTVIGGNLYSHELAFFEGDIPEDIQRRGIDLMFLGSSGVYGHDGICTRTLRESEMKRKMIRISKKKVALVDASKFSVQSQVETVPFEQLDLLITDKNIDVDVLERIRKKVEVVLV